MLNDLLQQFHRTLLAWVIRTQFTAKSTGENGFFHQFDLVKDYFGGFFGLLLFIKKFIKDSSDFFLLSIIRRKMHS